MAEKKTEEVKEAAEAPKAAVKEEKKSSGGFKWPWQVAAEEKEAEKTQSSTDLPPSPTPLSPYTR